MCPRCSPRILPLVLILGLLAPTARSAGATPFSADDLVRLERISDPQLSPDGSRVAYQLRQTDYAANRGAYSLWLRDLRGPDTRAHRLTGEGSDDTAPRWSPDGRALYFLSTRSGSTQVWKLALAGGEAQAVTHTPLDVGSFMLAPDGRQLLVSMEVFPDCDTLACTARRSTERAAQKASGRLYERLFIRHWDRWSDGTRSQLFVYALDGEGIASGEPAWITRGIDGDVPSQPDGDDSEYCFTPDGRSVIFSVRIAGLTEAWSTNFDLYQISIDGSRAAQNLTAANPAGDTRPTVSPDGRTLAYLARRRPGFEADRYALMLRELATGQTRELLPHWDRSPESLLWSADGKTLYALADELGQRRLFAIDVSHASVRALTDQGTVSAVSLAGGSIVYALDTVRSPAQLFHIPANGGTPEQLTTHNAELLAARGFGDYEQFQFKGWNGETVYGYVVKPADYVAGEKYPVAFIIHGCPQCSMGNHFHYRWNPEVYAGAGFGVIFIDFHGSPGYGQAFTDSISEHWGDRPLEDLQQGWAVALKNYPFLDGTRACALGASYGGYMVNWMAGNWAQPESGAWKCLVSHDGDFDLRMAYYATEELWFDEWERGGPQYQHPQNFELFNPVNHVDQWRTPMLVIHGEQDFRIGIEQGIATFTALQRRGIPSQLLRFPDENHWVLKPQNSVQWHETVLAWLKRWTTL